MNGELTEEDDVIGAGTGESLQGRQTAMKA